MINITKALNNNVLTAELDGKLYTATSPKVLEEISSDIDKAESLVLGMKKLTYISSAGLRVIITLHKNMKPKGGMKLINVSKDNMEVLEFTEFAEFLNIV